MGILLLVPHLVMAALHCTALHCISPEDILYSNFTSSARTFGKLPNHYIVMDHANDAVVVAFRGTLSLSEGTHARTYSVVIKTKEESEIECEMGQNAVY